MRIVEAGGSAMLYLGKQGENLATQIRFPFVKQCKRLFGEGVFQLIHQRKGDLAPYAVILGFDDDDVIWDITSTDVAKAGLGQCELIYLVDNKIAKSITFGTRTIESLSDAGEDPPEPWESWVEEVLEAGSRAEESARQAEEYADDIKELTVSSHQLSAGETPTVVKTGGDGTPYNLDFGLPVGGGGASSWSEITGKPFKTLGETLQVDERGVLNIVIPPEYGRVSYDGFELTVE